MIVVIDVGLELPFRGAIRRFSQLPGRPLLRGGGSGPFDSVQSVRVSLAAADHKTLVRRGKRVSKALTHIFIKGRRRLKHQPSAEQSVSWSND